MKILSLLGWVVSGIFITLCIVFMVKSCNSDAAYKIVKAERDSCWATKHTVDTVTDTIHVRNDSVIYKPKLVYSEKIIEIPIDCDSLKGLYFKRNVFAGKFKNEDFEIDYGVTVNQNDVEKVIFPSYNIFRKVIYDRKVVDTCIMKKTKIKNKLFLFARVGTDFTHLTQSSVGLHWLIFKDNLMLSPDVTFYDFYANHPSYNLSVGIKIR